MTEPKNWMRQQPTSTDAESPAPEIPTDRPTQARAYGLSLGSKDNYEVDRQMVTEVLKLFPEGVDIARQNRRFLYRAVSYLARDAGIDQFLDLGSGLPTENNVHEVAQEFQPGARVVYVDNDPIVLAHGRALLAKDASTTFIQADITDPEDILSTPEAQELLDLSRPVGVLLFSIPHCIPDDDAARRAVRGCIDRAPSGSFLTLSHVVTDDPAVAAEGNAIAEGIGMPWKTRTPAEVEPWLEGLHPVEPGLGNINDWRPDPEQPPLAEPHPVVASYLGASAGSQRLYEFGGVLRKP
ncbi:SAM-dependent methyltransferase [Lipingzhangella halophila]|uniref:SAM-dependent methyltransferase n=1 Tax=Lipingzhangella halophila TaxID=1783352 RepID=A0A7W7W5K0_9ACTN|nr:SAM-dependent methyltransferase [Lipingzhangella halophila]MBB4934861.1 SAM-dependent methyltransferase [Lipingzhangella halophila]